MQVRAAIPVGPSTGTTDDGEGGVDESAGCLVHLALATCDGEANTAGNGWLLKCDSGCPKDEGRG